MSCNGQTGRQNVSLDKDKCEMIGNSNGDMTKSLCNQENYDDASLMQIIHDRINVKDFCNEIRAIMDVEEFVHQGRLLMKQQVKISGHILDGTLIEHLLRQSSLESDTSDLIEEAKESLFVKGSKNLLVHVIKPSFHSNEANDVFELQNRDSSTAKTNSDNDELSWLITYASIRHIKRRHMILVQYTRDKAPKYLNEPVNMLMIILAPSSEKETKSGFEAARTFATLFNSMKIDYQWLAMEAKTETILMASLMIKAKQLFENKTKCSLFTNRHKYSFSPNVSIHIDKSSQKNNATSNNIFESMDNLNLALSQSSLNRKSLNDESTTKYPLPRFVETRASVALTHALDIATQKDIDLQQDGANKQSQMANNNDDIDDSSIDFSSFGRGLCQDLSKLLRNYPSDFKDAFIGPKRTIQKTIATIWWLYFGILLPIIAFNLLNHEQTNGKLGDLRKSIAGQALGGLAFALLGGQPLVIIMTTAPLCLYTKGS